MLVVVVAGLVKAGDAMGKDEFAEREMPFSGSESAGGGGGLAAGAYLLKADLENEGSRMREEPRGGWACEDGGARGLES